MDDFDFIPNFNMNIDTSSAAPKLDNYEYPEIRKNKKSSQQRKPETKTSQVRKVVVQVVASVAVAAVVMVMFSAVMYLNNIIVQNTHEISKLERRITEAQAENVRLSATLSATMSVDKIQDYAVGTLGMQKAERYQIHYFEDRDGDKVVVANGKAQNADKQDK